MKVDQCGLDPDKSQTRFSAEEMTDALAAGVFVHATSSADPDVRSGFGSEDPDAMSPQCFATGEGAAVHSRLA